MKSIKNYAFLSLIIRAILIAIGILIYLLANCPFEVNFHIFYAFCAFMLLEPLTILLIALLHEGPQNANFTKKES